MNHQGQLLQPSSLSCSNEKESEVDLPRGARRGFGTSGRRWTAEEDQLLRNLIGSGQSLKEAAPLLGRPYHSTKEHWRWINMTVEQRMERANRLRMSGPSGIIRRVDENSTRGATPSHLFEERDRRLSADRSLTCRLMGDPPPGFSALDRRRT